MEAWRGDACDVRVGGGLGGVLSGEKGAVSDGGSG